MPDPTVELYSGRSHYVDNDNKRGRRVLLANYPIATAESAPGVPSRGSSFDFGGEKLTLRTIELEPTENPSYTRVLLDYDNGTPGNLQREQTYKATELSSVRTILEIPAYRSALVIDTVAANGDPVYKVRWNQFSLRFDSYELNYQVRMNLAQMPSGYGTAIANQTGKLHYFYGLWWRFMGAQASNEERNRWQIVYNWVHDPGNAALNVESLSGTFGEYLKLPTMERGSFETYIANVQPDNLSVGKLRPVFGLVERQNVDQDGYKSLPGEPIS
jgi:hypothetical protein